MFMCVQGETALHLAAQHRSPGIVQLLLTHGADREARNPEVCFWLSLVHALNANFPCVRKPQLCPGSPELQKALPVCFFSYNKLSVRLQDACVDHQFLTICRGRHLYIMLPLQRTLRQSSCCYTMEPRPLQQTARYIINRLVKSFRKM